MTEKDTTDPLHITLVRSALAGQKDGDPSHALALAEREMRAMGQKDRVKLVVRLAADAATFAERLPEAERQQLLEELAWPTARMRLRVSAMHNLGGEPR